jgi:hypothetical protein
LSITTGGRCAAGFAIPTVQRDIVVPSPHFPQRSASRAAGLGAFAAFASLLVFTAGAAHAAAVSPGPGKITGLWLLDQTVYDRQEAVKLPLTPAAEAAATKIREARENGGVVLSDNNKKCLPIGMPGMVTNEFALEFLETPGKVTMVSENSPLVRSVYLDKAEHPKDLDPSWNGHSIGKWEGDVLVVKTAGLNDRVSHLPFGFGGLRTTSTTITERYHLENGGKTLVNAMTFEDPQVLTKPWTNTYRYRRADPGAGLWEYVCEVDAEGWSERFAGDPEFKKTSAAQ